jgi:hypothetical protein
MVSELIEGQTAVSKLAELLATSAVKNLTIVFTSPDSRFTFQFAQALHRERIHMHKLQVLPNPFAPPSDRAWLDIDRHAWVEVTSEEKGHPIESALLTEASRGWRAADPGIQRIRVMFHEPQKLRRIRMVFEDTENTRTQQFLLRWSPGPDHSFREIVRQEWNFSPGGSVREIEDYAVELSDVQVLELLILPDKRDSEVRASLLSLRLA